MSEIEGIDVVIVSNSGDWKGLYINGKCVYQHHDVEDVLGGHIVGKYIRSFSYEWASEKDNEMASKTGRFPSKLEELELT